MAISTPPPGAGCSARSSNTDRPPQPSCRADWGSPRPASAGTSTCCSRTATSRPASNASTVRAAEADRPRTSCSPTPVGPSSTPRTTTSRSRRSASWPKQPVRRRWPGSPSRGSPRSRSGIAPRSPTPDSETSPAQALAAALSDDGYVASTLPSALGEQLCQHHCPVAHVAEKFPQLCEAETEAFSRVLGVHVQRLATIAHGDGVCTTHIPRASGTSSIPRASGTTHAPKNTIAKGRDHDPDPGSGSHPTGWHRPDPR